MVFLEFDSPHSPPPTSSPSHFHPSPAHRSGRKDVVRYRRSQPLAGRLREICPTLVPYVISVR